MLASKNALIFVKWCKSGLGEKEEKCPQIVSEKTVTSIKDRKTARVADWWHISVKLLNYYGLICIVKSMQFMLVSFKHFDNS